MSRAPSLELRIESLAAGGEGVAHDPGGRAVFVSDTAPGDLVRVRLLQERPRWARGRVEQLLEPGPSRVDPVCPVFGSCGGCAWQHVSYASQLEAKGRILRDALQRIGRLPVPTEIPVEPSPLEYGYRTRARLLVERGRVGFRRRRSHALCPTGRCPVLAPALDRALGGLARRPPRDGEWEIALAEDGSVRVAPLHVRRGEPLRLRRGADSLRISPGVFFQANAPLFEALAAAVLDAAGRGGVAIELFAGAGYLTLGLARHFDAVTALESHPAACRDLVANCEAAGLRNVRVVQERVERVVAEPGRLPRAADVCVADPPRSGLPPGSARALAALRPRRLLLLSCDPATFARDLAELALHGYALRSVRGYDLFPQTPHVEALAVLEGE